MFGPLYLLQVLEDCGSWFLHIGEAGSGKKPYCLGPARQVLSLPYIRSIIQLHRTTTKPYRVDISLFIQGDSTQ